MTEKRTWFTLARIPYCPARSSPTNIAGTSPVDSANSAMLLDAGADGLSVPAANTPEVASGAKARDEMMPISHIQHIEDDKCPRENEPLRPSRLFLLGVVRSRVPSPGTWRSKTSMASSKPQYSLRGSVRHGCDTNESTYFVPVTLNARLCGAICRSLWSTIL